jgi:hypothetical protein
MNNFYSKMILINRLKKDAVMNQCIRLTESLTKFSKIRPVNEVKQAMHGIVSVLGNIRMVDF